MSESINLPWRSCGTRIYDANDALIADLADVTEETISPRAVKTAKLIVKSVNNYDKLAALAYKMFKQWVRPAVSPTTNKDRVLQQLIDSGIGDEIAAIARVYLIRDCSFDNQVAERFIDKYRQELVEDVVNTSGDYYWTSEDITIAVRRIIEHMCDLEV